MATAYNPVTDSWSLRASLSLSLSIGDRCQKAKSHRTTHMCCTAFTIKLRGRKERPNAPSTLEAERVTFIRELNLRHFGAPIFFVLGFRGSGFVFMIRSGLQRHWETQTCTCYLEVWRELMTKRLLLSAPRPLFLGRAQQEKKPLNCFCR